MSFRTVVIEKRSKLDLRMGYLVVRQEEETKRIFLDEINTLIVENPACCITGCLLSELVNRKIKIIFCDEKHSPVAELIPCHGHGESAGKLQEQILWDSDFCQSLWALIITEKIRNQTMFLLEESKNMEAELLLSYCNFPQLSLKTQGYFTVSSMIFIVKPVGKTDLQFYPWMIFLFP